MKPLPLSQPWAGLEAAPQAQCGSPEPWDLLETLETEREIGQELQHLYENVPSSSPDREAGGPESRHCGRASFPQAHITRLSLSPINRGAPSASTQGDWELSTTQSS